MFEDWLASARADALRVDYPRTKLLVSPADFSMLYCHLVGPESSTMLHQVMMLMHLNSDVRELANMIYIYPALNEGLLAACIATVAPPDVTQGSHRPDPCFYQKSEKFRKDPAHHPTNGLKPRVDYLINRRMTISKHRIATAQLFEIQKLENNKLKRRNITMKTNKLRTVITAFMLIAAAPLASAQRANMQSFQPVVEMKVAQDIPVGSKIAIACNSGGPVTILTVDEDRSYLKGFTCPVTKRVYSVNGGRDGGSGITYKTEDGFTARLLVMDKQ